jgi:hypothetical protein
MGEHLGKGQKKQGSYYHKNKGKDCTWEKGRGIQGLGDASDVLFLYLIA